MWREPLARTFGVIPLILCLQVTLLLTDPIHDGIGESAFSAADLLVPFLFPKLGAEDRRRSFTAVMDQLEEALRSILTQAEQEPFVQDQQLRVGPI